MPHLLWKRIESVIEKAPVDSVERIRLRQYTMFVLLGVPTMVAFGVHNLVRGHLALSLVIFASAIGLSAGWYALGRLGRGIFVYRINALMYCGLLTYMLVIGGEGGSKILWMYTFPPIAFFLIGKLEGIFWAAGMLLLGVSLQVGAVPDLAVYPYPTDFKVRFVTTYAIVAAIALWFEHFRETYRSGMETKCRELEAEILVRRRTEGEKEEAIAQLTDALAQVRVLRGLLPICTSCKKIRDEHGSWTQLEEYLDERSEAKFSHGICPDCAVRLYPVSPVDGG